MNTLAQKIKDIVEQLEGSDDAVSFRNDYSGRGMYGGQCVGVNGTMEQCMVVVGEVIKEMSREKGETIGFEQDFDDSVDALMRFKYDTLGYDVIVYWPNIKPLEEQEEI